MDNPFYKRATEYLRADQDFLAVVTPEPVTRFLKGHAEAGTLFDRLVRIWGTPGSGKTTLARVFEYSALSALFSDGGIPSHRDLAAAVVECRVIEDGMPRVLGCRQPMETRFRDFWQLPYDDNVRFRLMSLLLQAKSVLAWLRALVDTGIELDSIRAVPRAGAESRVASIGETGLAMQRKARAVETALYKVIGSVIPPQLEQLPEESKGDYAPFDILEFMEVPRVIQGQEERQRRLMPLVILDDANVLHPDQYQMLKRWLAARELRISRWMLARFDVLHPEDAFRDDDVVEAADRQPGLTPSRDIVEIRLQGFGPEEKRKSQRRAFRSMAKDMATRYLSRMPLFSARKITSLADILSTEDPSLPLKKITDLKKRAAARQTSLGITAERRVGLDAEVDRYAQSKGAIGDDVRTIMQILLMERYRKRTGGEGLFPGDDPEPSRPLIANSELEESARLHLLHEHNLPFFFGLDDLCDAASENAEQFLHLAAVLVDAAENQLSRTQRRAISPQRQNELLRERASSLLKERNFPFHTRVKRLARTIGEKCVQVTMEPNGWLRPNAYGMHQQEFDDLMRDRELSEALQFGMAYNIWYIKQNYSCQGETWCLIELAGTVCLEHGLSLRRGGFLKGTISEFKRWANDPHTAMGTRG